MCNLIVSSVYDEDTEIESVNELELNDLNNNDLTNLTNDKQKDAKQIKDIYKKKDQPYRKQYCPFDGCEAYFFVNWHLERHIRKHNGEKPFICTQDDCDKAFTCRSYLNKHIKQTHERSKKIRVRKTYRCSECDHVFKQKYNLKVHLYQHTGEKPFKCEKCEKSFANLSLLRKHTKTHDGYRCNRENCDYVANKWTELQKHVAEDHKETFKCEVCDKKFKERYALTRHMKIHSGERLACTYENCKRSYTNKRNLKMHIRIDHSEGTTFKCDYDNCSKTFKYKGSLTKHINKVHKTNRTVEQIKKNPVIYTHRVSYAEKLTGVQCCEEELKKILLDDKIYRKEVVVS